MRWFSFIQLLCLPGGGLASKSAWKVTVASARIHPLFKKVPVEVPVSLSATERRVLAALQAGPKSRAEIVAVLGCAKLTGNLRKALNRLDELGLITLTIPAQPNSSRQKRKITARGQYLLIDLNVANQ
jgi:hypothetical protein